MSWQVYIDEQVGLGKVFIIDDGPPGFVRLKILYYEDTELQIDIPTYIFWPELSRIRSEMIEH